MRATCRGRVCAGLAAVATIAGLLVAGPGLTAPAAASTSHATSATVVPTRAGGLTATQAMARARATRRGVIATALTTAQSQTTANPDGTLTVTQSLLPVRALRSGQWKNLNADLRPTRGVITPAVSASPLTLSAGGTGPLAVMTALGRTLSLYWPASLPAPAIAGPTATYRNVLPGVDLAVTADALGGITTTLIVRTPAAAASLALSSISLRAVATPGLHLTADAAGNLEVTAAAVTPSPRSPHRRR